MKPTDNTENLNKIAVLFVILLYQHNQEPNNYANYERATNIFIAGNKRECQNQSLNTPRS